MNRGFAAVAILLVSIFMFSACKQPTDVSPYNPAPPDSTIGISFGSGPENETIDWSSDPALSIDWNTGSLTVTVNTASGAWTSGASFAWYLDGAPVSGQTNSTITVDARDSVPGKHYLSVDITQNGDSYSKTLIFMITQ